MSQQILLIDDDVELASMLSEYLAAEGFETSAVHNGVDGVEAALSGRYAAVILDIMLPRMDGIQVLQRIRKVSRIPVIMLTAKGDDVDRVVGLEIGADDYMPKPCYSRELVARLRAVLRRTNEAPVEAAPRTLALGELTLSPPRRQAEWRGRALDLTVSEFNLLELLLRGGGDVVSKDELSEKALGRPREAYDRSVDVHIGNLRQKLHIAAGDAVEIETARGIGYALRGGG